MMDKLKKLVKGYRKSIEIMDARSKAGGERADEAFCRMLELERVVADLEELIRREIKSAAKGWPARTRCAG